MPESQGVLSNKRILLCPVEVCGNMQFLAEQLRRTGYHATAMAYCSQRQGNMIDICCGLDRLRSRVKKWWMVGLSTVWAATVYDVFHYFFGCSLCDLRFMRYADVRVLHRLGKKIFVHFRGSDVISQEYKEYLYNKARGVAATEPPMSNKRQRRSIEIWRRYASGLLVSYPLLLKGVPDAVLVRQAIDCDRWQLGTRSSGRPNGELRIAHAPTSRRNKGTELICDAVDRLKGMGYRVRLELIENVPHEKVKELYESCDVAIDQMIYGWYGNFSIELMALGKPVICYIDPSLANHAPGLPIVSADATNLTEKLARLADDASLRKELGEKGIQYVRSVHDVKVIAEQCVRLYERSMTPHA